MSKNQHGFRKLKPKTHIVEVHKIKQKKCLVGIATILFLPNVWSRQYIMSKNQHGFRKLKPKTHLVEVHTIIQKKCLVGIATIYFFRMSGRGNTS
jgi:hypothetical protein